MRYRNVADMGKKARLLHSTGRRCWYCGDHLSADHFTYDHVVPRKSGGKTTLTNLVASCEPCNRRKAAMSLEDYRRYCGVTQFYGETL